MTLNIKVTERGQGPTERPPPGDRLGTFIIDPGNTTPPNLPVYVARDARDAMVRHAKQGGSYEVGGFLLGGYHRHAGHRYLDITTQVPALRAKSERTHITFSNEVQREFHKTLGSSHPGKVVLGWVHSHPGYSVFLSEYDLFIQRSFFAEPHHVAVVVDPKQHFRRDRIGVFVWEEGEVSQSYHLIVYDSEPPKSKKKPTRRSGSRKKGSRKKRRPRS